MYSNTPRQSTPQTITAAHCDTLKGVVDSCLLLPSETPQRRHLVQAFLEIAPNLEYELGYRDEVFIRCELAGERFLEVRTLKALQLLQAIADINDFRLCEINLLILQHNLFVYGSFTPWYPDLSWLKNTTRSEG
jgi:hypothetical protein